MKRTEIATVGKAALFSFVEEALACSERKPSKLVSRCIFTLTLRFNVNSTCDSEDRDQMKKFKRGRAKPVTEN